MKPEIGYERDEGMRFFQDSELTIELDGSRISDEMLAEMLGGVLIVRCRDCTHYRRNIPMVGGKYNGCENWQDNGNEIPVDENFYCAHGERRRQNGEV